MKKIVKVLILPIFIGIVLFATGCETNKKSNDKLSIVSTIFPGYDFARQIADKNADITMLLSPGMESHNYDPTPQDIIKIENADIFIYVGGESDEWVDDILDNIDTSKTKVIKMMDSVDTLEEEVVEGMQEETEEETGGEHEEEYDEHVWTSPKNAIKLTKAISNAIIEKDAENKEQYENNTTAYVEKLESLDSDFKAIINNASRKEIIFGDRFPLRYFVEEYGLTYYAAFPGCSSDTEANASTIAFLIDKVKEDQIPVVFYIEMSNQKIAKTIAEETGAKTLEFHTAHNVTKQEFNNRITYIDIMKNNIKVLKEALS